MSRISQDFINSVGYLYEEINVQQNDFLNEESEYYDAEASELVEDIISSICLSMIYEGYSASTVIGFLADSSEEDILEKYLAFDGNILSESAVDKNYVEEQLELLENRLKAAASLGKSAFKTLFGKGPGYAATKLQGPRAPGLADKAKVVISKATQKVKDVASKAKEALPKVAKGAGIFGLGAAGGYVGAKMAGAGAPTSSNAPKPPSTSNTPAKPATPSKSTSSAPSSPSRGSKASSAATPAKPKSPAAAKSEWEKANPRLAQAEKLRQQGASREDINKVLYNKGTAASQGSGQSQMEKDAEELRRMTDRSKQRQGKLMGGPEGPGTIDTKSVEADIKAAQERQKKQMEQQKNAMTAKESYEPYDIVLDYLFSNGHADTLDEANYIMMEMDEDAIGTIIEQYEYYLLAEEVEEWVDGLVNEGYDLSEYTWDDIMEYYVNEAKEDKGLTPLQKIRKRNKNYAIEGEPAGDQTSNRRAERSSQRGVKKTKGEKSAFGTMRHVGGPYN